MFLPPPTFFFFSPAPGPRATMDVDVHLDTPEGQESASNSGKGSSGTGNQQGHYPYMNNNWDAMLNSLQGGDLLSFHKPHKRLSVGLSQRCTITNNVRIASPSS